MTQEELHALLLQKGFKNTLPNVFFQSFGEDHSLASILIWMNPFNDSHFDLEWKSPYHGKGIRPFYNENIEQTIDGLMELIEEDLEEWEKEQEKKGRGKQAFREIMENYHFQWNPKGYYEREEGSSHVAFVVEPFNKGLLTNWKDEEGKWRCTKAYWNEIQVERLKRFIEGEFGRE